jgi:hypothetical protein
MAHDDPLQEKSPGSSRVGRFVTWVFLSQLVLLGIAASAVATGWYRTIDVLRPEWVAQAVQVVALVITIILIIWGKRIGTGFGTGIVAIVFAGLFAGTLGAGKSIFFFIFGMYVGLIVGGTMDVLYKISQDKKRGYEYP